MIRKAIVKDITPVKQITEACARHMIANGIFQWNEHYPDLAVLKKDINQEALYVYTIENEIIGCVMFSFDMDDFYSTIDWLTPNKKQLYVHRLAVHPEQQGKGIARELMDFGEQLARENKCLSIRLDTFSKNPRNNRFYTARDYKKVGEVFFEQKSPHPFYCYEKVLD